MNIKYIIIVMYNKFSKSNVNIFGSQNISPISGLTPAMEEGLTTAIPIWQLLNITEEQDRPPPARRIIVYIYIYIYYIHYNSSGWGRGTASSPSTGICF
jgi:hypothetical protein